MWESLAPIALSGGPWALVSLFVLSVWRGWLIPRWMHQERVGDLKAAIAKLERTVDEREHQIGLLLGRAHEVR